MTHALAIDIERFNAEGYLVVEDVLDPDADLAPLFEEYAALLDTLATRWHAEGQISSAYADLPFDERLARVLIESGPRGYGPFDISLGLRNPFIGSDTIPMHLGPAVFAMLTNRRLLDAVEQVIGPEILSNPIQHVRIKPPEHLLPASFHDTLVTQTDWHQDQGVALPEIDATTMLTVWLAITDATEENGCLCVVPRSHRRGLVTHCPGTPDSGRGLHIPDAVRGDDVRAVPLRRGSALFMHRATMHSSLANRSQGIRWSFDLRYQPIGQPTGRPFFPAFVARSRRDPASEVRDPATWAGLWHAAYEKLLAQPVERVHRWNGAEPVCA